MTVEELITKLQEFDADHEVVLGVGNAIKDAARVDSYGTRFVIIDSEVF